jgi:phosphate transport system substrate-binding protein
LLAVLSAGVLALGVSACGGDTGSADTAGGGDTGAVSGDITLEGSSTVYPFAQAAAEAFQGENADVNLTVGDAGSTAGFEALCAGETDIADASSQIDEATTDTCKKNGIEPIELVVANDGISIITNPELAVDCLTTDELKQLWEKGSTVKSLSEINPDLPDTELALFGPGDESGTWTYFTETINGEEGNIRSDYSPSSDDNVIVQGVEGEPGGLGFLGFSYYEQNMDKLGIAAVDGGDGCITPSAETIQSGEYTPLSRPLYMYLDPSALEKPQVAAFLNYVLENDATIAETALIVPANDDQLSGSTDALGSATPSG